MRLKALFSPAERVGQAPQRRQVGRAGRGRRIRRRHRVVQGAGRRRRRCGTRGRRIRRRHRVVQGRTGHSCHEGGRCPEEPHRELPRPGEPERVRFHGFDLRGAPGTRQLDHGDQVRIAIGAENQLSGLSYDRLLRKLRHSNWPPEQRRLRSREKERAEQIGVAGYSLADRAHRGQPGATGSREMFRLRQPGRIRACDGFRQRLDSVLCEIAPFQTRGVHGDRQDCRPHAIRGFDDLSHRNRRRLGPAHQGLAHQRFDLRTAQGGAARGHRHEGGSYSNHRSWARAPRRASCSRSTAARVPTPSSQPPLRISFEMDHPFRGCGSRISVKWNACRSRQRSSVRSLPSIP